MEEILLELIKKVESQAMAFAGESGNSEDSLTADFYIFAVAQYLCIADLAGKLSLYGIVEKCKIAKEEMTSKILK